ncbi:MAG TPA: hypothetical protein VJ833_02110 [Rhodanobacteraceae bacterium]|nr:hypothetical protein [Rhodanobacteraceae bacterium]
MASPTKEQQDAAQQFVGLAIEALKNERGVHAETAIAGVARMAGTFLFRSFAFPLASVHPGQAVLSEAANEQGPKLIQALGNVLAHIGVVLDKSKLGVNKDPEHRPMLDFLATQKRLEPLFSRVMQALGLSCPQAAESAAIATAILIKQCVPVLDPNLAFGIAAYGFVEGSKTAPDPVVLAGSAV